MATTAEPATMKEGLFKEVGDKATTSLTSTSAVLEEFRHLKKERCRGAEMLALLRHANSLQVAICLDECGPRLRRTILDILHERPRDTTWDKR